MIIHRHLVWVNVQIDLKLPVFTVSKNEGYNFIYNYMVMRKQSSQNTTDFIWY